ncbi:NUC211 domain-containing protein [Pterulicium gracile]|uniref:U3 small nucleolar RNA-associated protein 10 n=1 Tax=Pterulicium gracile TaxID=1884261 RepID=A0A5C3Q2H9_9AGAR|nr:NUC211 domain-containing protein [Pterula gracilis]
MSTFWGTAELTQVIKLCLDASSLPSGKVQATATLVKSLTKQPAAKVLLPTLAEIWPSVEDAARAGKTEKVISYFDFLKRALRNAERDVVSDQLKFIFKLFLRAFEVVVPGSESQTKAISAFVELVVKLNDTTFKPMFRRLFDWAFADSSDKSVQKKISFCDVYIALLDYFKALVAPYMAFIFQASLQLLKGFQDLTVDSPDLWTRMLTLTLKSMTYDDGVFWHEDKARQFSGPLIQQIPVCVRLFPTSADARLLLEQCLVALAENTSDDIVLKTINLNVLLHTRSEETKVKLLALSCSEALWAAHAGKLLGFAPETATFIFECAEDDNDDVLQASVKLKEAVESVAGAISGL